MMRFLGGLLALLLLSASTAFGQGVPGQSWTNAVLNAPVTTSPGSTDVLAIIQGGVTKQVSYGNLLTGGGNISINQMKGTYGNFSGVPTFGGGCGTPPNVWCQSFVGGDPTGVGVGDIVGLAASYTNATANLVSPFWSQIYDTGAGTLHIATAANLNVTEWGSTPSITQVLSINGNLNSSNAGSFGTNIEAETIMLGPTNAFGFIVEAGGDTISGHGMVSYLLLRNVGPTSGLPCSPSVPCTNNMPLYGIEFTSGTPGSTAPYGNPIQLNGTLIKVTGADQFVAVNGIDLSNSDGGGSGITGCAYKSQAYCVDGTGDIATGGFAYILQSSSPPAGGTTGLGLKISSTTNFGIFFGSSAPTLSAAHGSLYLRSDGNSSSTRAYINTDGGTTWTPITTGS